MAHMQGANAVVAQYERSLEGDQVSILLLRQLKLANVDDSSSLHFQPAITDSEFRYFMPLESPDRPFTSARCGNP